MHYACYAVEVTGLSPSATEKHVYDFFNHCGTVQTVEIIGSGEYARTAYVTFADVYAMQTAVLLSGATIVDQRVCITPWGTPTAEYDHWNSPPVLTGDDTSSMCFLDFTDFCSQFTSSLLPEQTIYRNQYIPAPGVTVTLAQDIVTTMLSKGYVLAKDALAKAKAFDEEYRISARAAARFVEISKSAAAFTGRTAVAAAHAVVNSTYFAKGAQWVSGALARAAEATAEYGSKKSS
ncbi:hypothetical protein Tsubulata_009759 [Turnera subulata]|uniref:RRM domain-containing protein n=1 Tax=Turnera subulata TaxID=218843 RepID=A0A9Q0F4H7_9ROSI|nr:hypothetical protein Tsubulata_009759 [Turnera subulata]